MSAVRQMGFHYCLCVEIAWYEEEPVHHSAMPNADHFECINTKNSRALVCNLMRDVDSEGSFSTK